MSERGCPFKGPTCTSTERADAWKPAARQNLAIRHGPHLARAAEANVTLTTDNDEEFKFLALPEPLAGLDITMCEDGLSSG
jgi:hypothetical protein